MSTIHSTGKKNTMPTIQATMPTTVWLLPRFFLGVTVGLRAVVMPGAGRGDVCACHHAACSVPENDLKISRSAKVAMMIVMMTTTTPIAAAWPTWKPRKARW